MNTSGDNPDVKQSTQTTDTSPLAQPKPSLLVDQHVAFTLRAPDGWAWWLVCVLAMAMLAAAGGMVLLYFAIFTLPSPLGTSAVKGARALWLWVVGLAACASTLVGVRGLKPDDMTFGQWWQASPVELGIAVALAVGALGSVFWLISWVQLDFPAEPDNTP